MNGPTRGVWDNEYAGHGPAPGGVATVWSRHEPRLHGAFGPTAGEKEDLRQIVANTDAEPRADEWEWIPGVVDRRTMSRRLAERRAAAATPRPDPQPPALDQQVPGRFWTKPWRSPHLIALVVALVLGFVAGWSLTVPRDAREKPDRAPTLRLDTSIGSVGQPQESSRRLVSPSAIQ